MQVRVAKDLSELECFLPRNLEKRYETVRILSLVSGHLPGDHIRFFDQGMHVMPDGKAPAIQQERKGCTGYNSSKIIGDKFPSGLVLLQNGSIYFVHFCTFFSFMGHGPFEHQSLTFALVHLPSQALTKH